MKKTVTKEELYELFSQIEKPDSVEINHEKAEAILGEMEDLAEQIRVIQKKREQLHQEHNNVINAGKIAEKEYMQLVSEEAKYLDIDADGATPEVGRIYKDVNGSITKGGLFKCVKLDRVASVTKTYYGGTDFVISAYWNAHFERIHTKTAEVIDNVWLQITDVQPFELEEVSKDDQKKLLEKALRAKMSDMDPSELSKLLAKMNTKEF